jgi:hypothetical protein
VRAGGRTTDFTDFTDEEDRQHGGPQFWHSTDNVEEPEDLPLPAWKSAALLVWKPAARAIPPFMDMALLILLLLRQNLWWQTSPLLTTANEHDAHRVT